MKEKSNMIFTELNNESTDAHNAVMKEELIAAIPGSEGRKQGLDIILNVIETPSEAIPQIMTSGDKSDVMCIFK